MALTIKDAESCRLARDTAAMTGRKLTKVILIALKEELEHRQRLARADEVRAPNAAMRKRLAKLLKPGPSAVEQGDWLYEEQEPQRRRTPTRASSTSKPARRIRADLLRG